MISLCKPVHQASVFLPVKWKCICFLTALGNIRVQLYAPSWAQRKGKSPKSCVASESEETPREELDEVQGKGLTYSQDPSYGHPPPSAWVTSSAVTFTPLGCREKLKLGWGESRGWGVLGWAGLVLAGAPNSGPASAFTDCPEG